MKRINGFLNIIMWVFLGIFIGITIECRIIDRTYPERYIDCSSPWFLYEPLSALILLIHVVVICLAIKLILKLIKHYTKKKPDDTSIDPQ